MRSSRPYPIAQLPRVSRAEAHALREAARRLPELPRELRDVAGLGHPMAIEGLPLERCVPGAIAASLSDPLVALVLDDGAVRGPRVVIEVEPRLASIVIDRALGGEGTASEPFVPSDVERGVLAYVAARFAAHIAPGVLRVSAVITSPLALAHAVGDAGALVWPARVALGEHRGMARVWIPDALLARASSALPPSPARVASLATLRASCALSIGTATLAASELAALELGDVVVPEASDARLEGGVLAGEARLAVIGGAWSARVELRTSALVIVAIEQTSSARPARLEEPMSGAEDGTDRMLRAAGETPVALAVELARVELTVAQLASLRAGEVLTTGTMVGTQVSLRAGDRVVARGELVDVEGELGVRILELG